MHKPQAPAPARSLPAHTERWTSSLRAAAALQVLCCQHRSAAAPKSALFTAPIRPRCALCPGCQEQGGSRVSEMFLASQPSQEETTETLSPPQTHSAAGAGWSCCHPLPAPAPWQPGSLPWAAGNGESSCNTHSCNHLWRKAINAALHTYIYELNIVFPYQACRETVATAAVPWLWSLWYRKKVKI